MKTKILSNRLAGVIILSCITFGSPFQVSASPILPADIDSNGKVDVVDFAYISSQWQTDGSAVPSADIAPLPNGDNVVNMLDLLLYAQSLLELEPVAVSLTIPDPNAIELSGTPARWIITTSGGFNVASVDVNISFSASEAEFFGAASPADYNIRDTGNNPIPNPVTIPVPGSLEVFLHPVNDGIIEPAERLTMTIDPGEYVVTANDLPANIYDADDSEANNTLLLAYLLPEAAAQTAASGYATLIMNGSNTRGFPPGWVRLRAARPANSAHTRADMEICRAIKGGWKPDQMVKAPTITCAPKNAATARESRRSSPGFWESRNPRYRT